MRHAQATIRQGYGWVVDIDLEAFFDRVNHDRLMVRANSGNAGSLCARLGTQAKARMGHGA